MGQHFGSGGFAALPRWPHQFHRARLWTFVAFLFRKTDAAADAEAVEVCTGHTVAMEVNAMPIGFDEAIISQQLGHLAFDRAFAVIRNQPNTLRVFLDASAQFAKRIANRNSASRRVRLAGDFSG